MPIKYKTVRPDELLLIAEDRLRDMESDHFRLSITQDPDDKDRLDKLEAKIISAQEVHSNLLPAAEEAVAARAEQAKKDQDENDLLNLPDARREV